MSPLHLSMQLPDFGKCAPAIGDIIPNAKEGIEHFIGLSWIEIPWTGSKDFNQDPFFACWTNIPLCLGVICVPCCAQAVALRSMEKMSGKSCESGCLSCCLLSGCCCIWHCYYSKKRTEMRKKYGIKGSPCFDCFAGLCFGGCLMCQDANQLMESEGLNVPYCSLSEAKAMAAKIAPKS